MLGRQYVPKDVCRHWHSRVSTSRPWRMGADRIPTLMVPAQLSVPLQQIEEYAPKPVGWMFPADDL